MRSKVADSGRAERGAREPFEPDVLERAEPLVHGSASGRGIGARVSMFDIRRADEAPDGIETGPDVLCGESVSVDGGRIPESPSDRADFLAFLGRRGSGAASA